MYVESMDDLDKLSDDELWEVAASTRNSTEMRHAAIRRWLYPENGDPETEGGARAKQLLERATILPRDEVEEDDIEEMYRPAPYFDGQGGLIVEYNGVQYRIDPIDEELGEGDESAAV